LNTNIPDKLTFKKREVINITRLDGKVLDYWDREFELINPVVNLNGEKYFSRKDIEIIIRIKELLIGARKGKEETKAILLSEFEEIPIPEIKSEKLIKKMKGKSGEKLKTIKKGLKEILTLLNKDDK